MSKRLDFLAKVRPEAATAYLTFLKESGKHLDDKTRFLISVVTKVISGTHSGLKQYVPHAIRAGATGQEIIDAVLMAFPAAGLTKVLDAFAVLQEMNLPELSIDNLTKEYQWINIAPINDFQINTITPKEIGGRKLLIYRYEDNKFHVYDQCCPHLGNKLPAKAEGTILTCPSHKWKFDLVSGNCIEKGTRSLHHFKHRIENNFLQVELIPLN